MIGTQHLYVLDWVFCSLLKRAVAVVYWTLSVLLETAVIVLSALQ